MPSLAPSAPVSAAADLDEDLATLEARVPAAEIDVIPLVHRVQEHYGYLPRHALEWVARRANVRLAHVFGVATFYSGFYVEPRGRDVIRVCQGTACHVAGAERITEHLSGHLGVPPGGTTDDLSFTLEAVACVGCCSLAPVMTIGEETYARLDPKEAVERVVETQVRGEAGAE